MARNPLWDTEKLCSHAPRVGAGEPGAAATTRRVEGAPATASADGDGPDLLGSTVEVVDELAGFGARGTARDRGRLAPAWIQMLLGVEESAPTRSAQAWDRAPRSDSADEPRQSPLGCTKNPRRAVEARPNGLAGNGFEVHGPASEAAVAGVADIFEEPRPGSDRVGFLHGAHRDLSSPVRARDTATAGAGWCISMSRSIRLRNGRRANCSRRARWRRGPSISFGTETKSMESDFRVRPRRWTSGRRSSRPARRGKTRMPSG